MSSNYSLWFNGPHNAFLSDTTLAAEVSKDANYPIRPSYGSQVAVTPDVTPIQFGDGYSQYVRKLVDREQRDFQLQFRRKRGPVITALQRFLSGEGPGSIYSREPNEFFYWLPGSEWNPKQTALRCLVVEPYQVIPEGYDSWSISVKFVRVKTP